jgi:hypothetical protein
MELNEWSPSSLNFDLPLGTYKLKILLKPWKSIVKIGKIPAHET